jgi:DNA helicase HerA-like ATPase
MTIDGPVIGAVSAVGGVQLTVTLTEDAVRCRASTDDELPLNVGSLIKMRTRYSTVFASLTDLGADRGAGADTAPAGYIGSADLIGEVADGTGRFQRGVSDYPPVGADVYRADLKDIADIYDCGGESKVRIGRLLRQGSDIAAHVMMDPLLSRHFAVLGSTGTGKSTAVALLLRAILEANRSGHVVLLDPHNEYQHALSDLAEVIDLTSLRMPCWMLNFEEMGAIMVPAGDAQEREMQLSILKEAIIEAKLNYAGPGKDTSYITVDTPVPYRIGDIGKLIERAMARPNRPIGVGSFLSLIERLRHLERDRRYEFLFAGFQIRDELPGLMSRILKIPSEGKPMTILDLSGVPSEVVDVVVSLLCRIIFDFALWSDHRKSSPLLMICEEAHRYVPERIEVGFAATRRSIERIAKEGRKYGVGLGLISQRPSEVDASILSQCGTLIAFRLSNERDQSYVAAALPEYAHRMVAELPSLRRQEAIVVGEGVPLAMRMRFDDVDEPHRPHVVSTSFSAAWQRGNLDQRFIDETIDHWRMQRRHR